MSRNRQSFSAGIGLTLVIAVSVSGCSDPRSKAKRFFEAGKYEQAAEIYERLLVEEKGAVTRFLTHQQIASCWVKLERHGKAAAAWGQAIDELNGMIATETCPFPPVELVELFVRLHYSRAYSHEKQGDKAAARDDVARAERIRADYERFDREVERVIQESPPEELDQALRRVPHPDWFHSGSSSQSQKK